MSSSKSPAAQAERSIPFTSILTDPATGEDRRVTTASTLEAFTQELPDDTEIRRSGAMRFYPLFKALRKNPQFDGLTVATAEYVDATRSTELGIDATALPMVADLIESREIKGRGLGQDSAVLIRQVADVVSAAMNN